MIPHIIHYCWFGGKPLPRSARKCVNSWKKFFPDYEISQWNESNYDVRKIPYTAEAYDAGKYAFVSDYVRFDILNQYGGIYFDTDVEVIKPYDDIFINGAFMGCETDGGGKGISVNPGLGMAADPGLSIYKDILDYYNTQHFLNSDGSINAETVVKRLTGVLIAHGLRDIEGIQKLESITVYPRDYFNPLQDSTGVLTITKNTHSIHWYAKSWIDPKAKLRSRLTRPFHRLFGEDCFQKLKMDKKRIIIIAHTLELGGAEKSLIGLLWALRRPEYQVDLFLLRHEGEMMDMIPPYVKLLSKMPAYTVLARPIKAVLKEGHIVLAFARLWGKRKAVRFVRKHHLGENGVGLEYSHKFTYRLMPPIQPGINYHAAISFLTPHYIAGKNVRADRKICWIHTDYGNVAIDKESEYKMWCQFDHIVAISVAAKKSFIAEFPQLIDRLTVIENILPEKFIRRQAKEKTTLAEDGTIKILSAGRFSYPKNFDNVPDICRRLAADGLKVTWYLIGYGPDEALIRQRIIHAGMQEHVIILGKKDNPYPYIRACDLYVQPSRYEGKCVAVREAQMLGKPVVITDYATSSSQLENDVDGVIVPLDNAQCAAGIADLLRDPYKMERLKKNCLGRDYSNADEIEKVYHLIDD